MTSRLFAGPPGDDVVTAVERLPEPPHDPG
ncbi:hypothetical protein HD595_004799 [Nonomuraea roseoviolacea subsp. carminata]|uniref:Uncharacterized protein n=1 Tax=Nonomuraea roseoviolacea subsp. carminata TaxID=160689 RepID=A0ABT1K3U5_9ACTN|nr:hypothetical protein [Nonomuraea roseoviolacea subsp. carminata]